MQKTNNNNSNNSKSIAAITNITRLCGCLCVKLLSIPISQFYHANSIENIHFYAVIYIAYRINIVSHISVINAHSEPHQQNSMIKNRDTNKKKAKHSKRTFLCKINNTLFHKPSITMVVVKCCLSLFCANIVWCFTHINSLKIIYSIKWKLKFNTF